MAHGLSQTGNQWKLAHLDHLKGQMADDVRTKRRRAWVRVIKSNGKAKLTGLKQELQHM
jgi:hypothetical protein